MNPSSNKILLLAHIPADLRSALETRFQLVQPDEDGHAEARIAVTTAMRGLSSGDLVRFAEIRLVLSQGVGLEKLDLEAATARGVMVSVTPNILTEDVADFAIGMTYAICRRIAEADRFVRAGRWTSERIRPSSSLNKKRMGIVGLGRIGQAIARRATGLGMKVSYTSRSPNHSVDHEFVPTLEALAGASDVLVLACPGGEATRGLVDEAVLEALGPSGFLVNVSRGSVVNEAALIAALRDARIAGAALDVFENEPELNQAFLELDNILLTPHSASVTYEVRSELIHNMLAEAEAFLGGQELENLANKVG